MSDIAPNSPKLSSIASFLSDAKTVAAISFTVIVGIFWAGWWFSQMSSELSDRLNQIDGQSQKIEVLEINVSRFRDVDKWSPISGEGRSIGLPGGVSYGTGECPPNYYASGIRATGSTSESKYCVGCLVSVQLICRPLHMTAR